MQQAVVWVQVAGINEELNGRSQQLLTSAPTVPCATAAARWLPAPATHATDWETHMVPSSCYLPV